MKIANDLEYIFPNMTKSKEFFVYVSILFSMSNLIFDHDIHHVHINDKNFFLRILNASKLTYFLFEVFAN